jgi:hypothetical protein
MVELDIDRLLDEFFQRAEAFIAAPHIREALELDELAGRANTACTTRYGTECGITACFTEFMRALPKPDLERLQQSVNAIRSILAEVKPSA